MAYAFDEKLKRILDFGKTAAEGRLTTDLVHKAFPDYFKDKQAVTHYLDRLVSEAYLSKRKEGWGNTYSLNEYAIAQLELEEKRQHEIIEKQKEAFIQMEEVRKAEAKKIDDVSAVPARFLEFIQKTDYEKRLRESVNSGSRSFIVSFMDLERFDPELADNLLDNPAGVLEKIQEAVDALDLSTKEKIYTRIYGLRSDLSVPLNELRTKHLGKLVSIEGIIRRASEVRPEVAVVEFECLDCGNKVPILQNGPKLKRPSRCVCGKTNLFRERDKTFRDVQLITLEQTPDELSDGAQPSRVDVLLYDDLTEPSTKMKRLAPGQRIKVIGMLKEKPLIKNGQTEKIFDIYIVANSIDSSKKEEEELRSTPEEQEKFREMVRTPGFWDKFTRSIAPSLYGHDKVKEAIALQFFGGVPKIRASDGMKIRGNIHIFLVGDPGTGKSMLLKYASRFAPRTKFVSGKGASSAGLTAAVMKDEFFGGFTLEAGVVVLCNKGGVCLDEIDKMAPDDRAAMHEVMEQGEIAIDKANIHANLQADVWVLAAANPKGSHYDAFKDVVEQIDLPESLLSRFDAIFPIIDRLDKEEDSSKADHILDGHMHPEKKAEDTFESLTLKKYIAFAKTMRPRLTAEAAAVIKAFYVNLRGKAAAEKEKIVPVTARSLEGLVRFAEARAKARLSEIVDANDANCGVAIFQFCLDQMVDPETGKYDANRLSGGQSSVKKDRIARFWDVFREAEKNTQEKDGNVKTSVFLKLLVDKGVYGDFDLAEQELRKAIKNSAELWEPRPGLLRKVS